VRSFRVASAWDALWPFVAFFLSGASSLVFQMIWSRLLHHVFGSSSVAISSVVSVFMGGLALGAFLAGRIADRLRRPLLAYAVAELGVALFGLLVPTALRALRIDPRIASGPMTLAATDLATLFLYLGTATIALR